MNTVKDIALIVAVLGFFLGIIYLVRVLPYGGDWRCMIAECRITK